jgi:hypothetical protein
MQFEKPFCASQHFSPPDFRKGQTRNSPAADITPLGLTPLCANSGCEQMQQKPGAVGTRVASRPPHRPVRAAFPHTVPTSGTDNQALRLDVCSPALALALRQPRVPGPESGSWRAGPHSPRPLSFTPPTPPRISFPGRFVRRLSRYYDRARLPASVHHRLRLLAFPMRTVPLTRR